MLLHDLLFCRAFHFNLVGIFATKFFPSLFSYFLCLNEFGVRIFCSEHHKLTLFRLSSSTSPSAEIARDSFEYYLRFCFVSETQYILFFGFK